MSLTWKFRNFWTTCRSDTRNPKNIILLNNLFIYYLNGIFLWCFVCLTLIFWGFGSGRETKSRSDYAWSWAHNILLFRALKCFLGALITFCAFHFALSTFRVFNCDKGLHWVLHFCRCVLSRLAMRRKWNILYGQFLFFADQAITRKITGFLKKFDDAIWGQKSKFPSKIIDFLCSELLVCQHTINNGKWRILYGGFLFLRSVCGLSKKHDYQSWEVIKLLKKLMAQSKSENHGIL